MITTGIYCDNCPTGGVCWKCEYWKAVMACKESVYNFGASTQRAFNRYVESYPAVRQELKKPTFDKQAYTFAVRQLLPNMPPHPHSTNHKGHQQQIMVRHQRLRPKK